ncbi:hypothetical protein BU17DRAFT_67458 [Hysterangium stoloniferum]|nr:hypothetical protein BU17DRAFT_67458 [Hysterangium stoloniferum]
MLEPVLEVLQDIGETWKVILESVQELVLHCEHREQWWATKDSRRAAEGLGQQELSQDGFEMVDWPGTTLSVMGRDREQAIGVVDEKEEMLVFPPKSVRQMKWRTENKLEGQKRHRVTWGNDTKSWHAINENTNFVRMLSHSTVAYKEGSHKHGGTRLRGVQWSSKGSLHTWGTELGECPKEPKDRWPVEPPHPG